MHPADEFLSRLSASEAQVPLNRVAMVRAAFNETFATQVDGMTEVQYKSRLVDWLLDSSEGQQPHLTLPRKGGRRRGIHPTLAHKAAWLQSQECQVCDVHLGPGITVKFGIRISPFSAQTHRNGVLQQRKRGVHEQIKARRVVQQPWPAHVAVCMQVTALVQRSTRVKDVDNMVKGILDALQGVLYENDSTIQHLNVIRLTHDLDEGFYLLHARPARQLSDDIIDDARCVASWKQPIIDPLYGR